MRQFDLAACNEIFSGPARDMATGEGGATNYCNYCLGFIAQMKLLTIIRKCFLGCLVYCSPFNGGKFDKNGYLWYGQCAAFDELTKVLSQS